jgi:hypothetical protein
MRYAYALYLNLRWSIVDMCSDGRGFTESNVVIGVHEFRAEPVVEIR